MKLYGTVRSPYVRKAMIAAIEAGVDDEVEMIAPAENVWVGDGDAELSAANPLGKVPVLTTREGFSLIDSAVICEYLASIAPEKFAQPADAAERWEMANFQSLVQGAMDAMVAMAAESNIRPEGYGWPDWAARQRVKISRVLERFETLFAGSPPENLTLGLVTLGSALGYLEQRLGDKTWRANCPVLARWFDEFQRRPSMTSTMPAPLPPPDQDPRRG